MGKLIHLLYMFHCFLLLGSLLHFYINYFSLFSFFCFSIYTCDCSVRVTAVLEYLESGSCLPRGMVTIPAIIVA